MPIYNTINLHGWQDNKKNEKKKNTGNCSYAFHGTTITGRNNTKHNTKIVKSNKEKGDDIFSIKM